MLSPCLHLIAHMLSMQSQERGQFKHIPRCWASSPVHALTCTMVTLPTYQQVWVLRSPAPLSRSQVTYMCFPTCWVC